MKMTRRRFHRHTARHATMLALGSVFFAPAIRGQIDNRDANAMTTDAPLPPSPLPATAPSPTQITQHLRLANKVAQQAMDDGHHPFGAVLVAPDNITVVMTQGNISPVQHAESELARRAFAALSPDELWGHTLYTTVEPCAMCAGTQYWANIGRLVFGISERELLSMTGAHEENPTMDIPSRYVFANSQKDIEVIGPIPDVAEEIAALHKDFWTD